jgi:hypothetical protein
MIWSLLICIFIISIGDRLKKAIKKHAVQLVNQKLISEKLAKYFTSLEKEFEKSFEDVMKHN